MLALLQNVTVVVPPLTFVTGVLSGRQGVAANTLAGANPPPAMAPAAIAPIPRTPAHHRLNRPDIAHLRAVAAPGE
jgi:hypothetical protein